MQPFLLNMLVNRLPFSAFELRPDEQIVNSEITQKIFSEISYYNVNPTNWNLSISFEFYLQTFFTVFAVLIVNLSAISLVAVFFHQLHF